MSTRPPNTGKDYKLAFKVLLPIGLIFVVIALHYVFPDHTIVQWLWIGLWGVAAPGILFYYLFVYPDRRDKNGK